MKRYEFYYEVGCVSIPHQTGYCWVKGTSKASAYQALVTWIEQNFPAEYGWKLLQSHITRTDESKP